MGRIFRIIAVILAMITAVAAFSNGGLVLGCTVCVDEGLGIGSFLGFFTAVSIGLFLQGVFTVLGAIFTLMRKLKGPIILWLTILPGILSIVSIFWLPVWGAMDIVLAILAVGTPFFAALFATIGVVMGRGRG